ncbi:hypothetical protein FB107DRAFT_271977 [Schizophyllum commune]
MYGKLRPSPPFSGGPRRDGHLGPSDPFEHAQYFRLDIPYAAFVLRATDALRANHPAYRRALDPSIVVLSAGVNSHSTTAAFVVALQGMNDSLHAEMSQLLPAAREQWSALADSQPSFPADADIRQLVKPAPFAAYVDHFTHVQRGLRAKLAWTEAVKRLSEDQGMPSMEELRKRGAPLADMRFLGVWVNTTPEHAGLWLLLKGRVPIYVAEQVKELKEPIPPSHILLHSLPSRSLGAEVADRALRSRSSYLPPRYPVEQPTTMNAYLTHAGCLGWRPTPQMERHVVDVDGFPHGWIQAPPIPNAKTERSWDVWAQSFYYDGEDRVPCFLKVSRERATEMVEDSFCLYDEEDTRLYFIDGRPEYHGLVDFEVFGMPIPRYRHFYPSHPDDNDLALFSCRPAGRWGYASANLAQRHGGRVQVRPNAPSTSSASRLSSMRSKESAVPAPSAARSTAAASVPPAARPAAASVPPAARPAALPMVPSAARERSQAATPMDVDPPARPLSPPVSEEAVLRSFTDWQLEFPPHRFTHEPRPRSRLQPQQRGRFAYHVRVAPRHELSWARVLRALVNTPAYRAYEFDFAFRALEGSRSVFGFTLPDEQLARSFVATLHRQGLAFTSIDARVLSLAKFSSLAAVGMHNDRWERPPYNRQAWSRASDQWTSPARRGRAPASRWTSSRDPPRWVPSPSRLVTAPSLPLALEAYTLSASPVARASSSLPFAAAPYPYASSLDAFPEASFALPGASVAFTAPDARCMVAGAIDSFQVACLHCGVQVRGTVALSLSLVVRRPLTQPLSFAVHGAAFAAIPPALARLQLRVLPFVPTASALPGLGPRPASLARWRRYRGPTGSDPQCPRPPILAADPATAGPSRLEPPVAASARPSRAPPTWPLAQSPTAYQRAVFESILSAWPSADPLAVAQAALSARPADDDPVDEPMDVDPVPAATVGASASSSGVPGSLQSRLSDAPPGIVPDDRSPTPPPLGARSLLDRVERPPLSTRISDGVPVPDLDERLTEEGEIPRGRQRGG